MYLCQWETNFQFDPHILHNANNVETIIVMLTVKFCGFPFSNKLYIQSCTCHECRSYYQFLQTSNPFLPERKITAAALNLFESVDHL